ncbi:MAG: hypothetical protein M3Y33_16430 [Actinomycetota bacterium]|nr:hypothetical protein [Actinomycetota bacterium]
MSWLARAGPRAGQVLRQNYGDWAAMSLFVHGAGRYPAFWIKSPAFDVTVIGSFLRLLGQPRATRKTGESPKHRDR